MPRYRVLRENAVVNGMPYPLGAEVSWAGWPKAYELEAVDEAAKRIAAYFQKRHHMPFLPKTPVGATGKIYLPALLPNTQGRMLPGWRKDEKLGMPRYRTPCPTELTGHTTTAGEEICFIGWPTLKLEPTNEPARAVVRYQAEYQAHPDFPLCPWNDFDDSLWLPPLRGPEQPDKWPFPGPEPHGFRPTRQPDPHITPQLRDPARAVQDARSRHWGEFKS